MTTTPNDRSLIEEALAWEQRTAAGYSDAAGKSVTPKVRQKFLELLWDEHQTVGSLSDELIKRGWLHEAPATSEQCQAARKQLTPPLP